MSTSSAHQQSLADIDFETRPPMLERGSYIPWKGETSIANGAKDDKKKKEPITKDTTKVSNSFSALVTADDDDTDWGDKDHWKESNSRVNESDSEEVEEIVMEDIHESHVQNSNLVKLCSCVFNHWDWTSNGSLCSKGHSYAYLAEIGEEGAFLFFLNIWTPNTLLRKDEIKSAPVWIKLHHVPIVAYSEVGLSLITTQIGRPIMLDTYTSSMCLKSWGRKEYARALVEVLAEEELLESLVVAIPKNDGKGHTLATISIEYEWKPPRCGVCKVFDHVEDKCPKVVKSVVVEESTKNDDDGFTEVKKKKHKPKQPKQVEGVRLSKPKPNFYYRRVEKGENSIANAAMDDKKKKEPITKDTTKVSNSFSALVTADDDDTDWGDKEHWKELNSRVNESDSEEVEEIVMEDRHGNVVAGYTGASTPGVNVSND
ncbi:reverse transcriptase domain, reverse transcriptase zinc-binding domain protein [Tanacetum coccineum]